MFRVCQQLTSTVKNAEQSFYRQACAQRSHAGIVFTHRPKNGFFAPQGRHAAPINVKVGTAPTVRTFTFIGAKMWEYSPQSCQNFEFQPEICTSGATRLQYFYEILSVCTPRLQVAFKFLVWSLSRDKHPSYKHFLAVGDFPTNCQQPLAAKLLLGSKKSQRGAKMGRTSSITMPSMVGILGRAPAVDEKV